MNTPGETQNNILIVDDTPKNLTVLRQILSNNNYRVHPVLSGELALKIAQKVLPDLILLDIVMPNGIDGYEVCRRLKADEHTRDIPVLFVSALDSTSDKMRAFEIGGVDYITKPFQVEEVLARVDTHLNLQNARKQLQQQNAQLREREETLRIQRDVAMALSAESSLEGALQILLNGILDIRGIDCAGVYLIHKAEGSLELVAHQGFSAQFVRAVSHYDADSPQVHFIMTQQPVYRNYAEILPETYDEVRQHEKLRATAVIPILHEHQVMGALNLASRSQDTIPQDIRRILETIASQAGGVVARIRTAKALKASRKNLQNLFDTLDDFLFILDTKGYLLYSNPVVSERLGYSYEELRDMTVLDFHPPARREEAAAIVGEMLAGKTRTCPVPLIMKDGTLLAVETKVTQGTWNDTPVLFGISRDISERKKAEEDLRRLKKAIETTGVGITIADSKGKIVYTNPADAQMHGYQIDELVGQPSNIFTLAEYRQGIHHDETFEDFNNWERERVNMRKDGSVFPVKLTSSPIHDTQRFRIGTVTVCEDISQRKEAEETLKRAKEAAESANRAKSAFLASMSHELRTPLNAILGFAQILNQRYANSEKSREYLNIIMRSGEHLLTLINQVLDLSKIEAGRITLDENEFDLHHLLKLLEDMFSFRADDKGLLLSFTRAQNVPCVIRSDEVKLRQTFINLLNNALKFTNQGEIHVNVRCEELVFESGRPDTEHCLLIGEVSDTGIGIAPEELEHLFEAFVQTKAGRLQQEGTGLGLSICRKFVQLLGGDIHVKSEPGQGSTFTFEVQIGLLETPSGGEQHTLVENPPVSVEPGQVAYRMLVVDDKEDNRTLLSELLAPFGFEVREASNGLDAEHLWEQWQPHVVFLDARMPSLNGFEVARHMKATPQGGNTSIIMLSASILEEDRTAALEAGCDEFLRKPFHASEVFTLLHSLLGIQFVYEDAKNGLGEESVPDAASEQLTPVALLALPVGIRQELEWAVTASNLAEMQVIVDRISEQTPDLASALKSLIDDFEYSRILELLQAIH